MKAYCSTPSFKQRPKNHDFPQWVHLPLPDTAEVSPPLCHAVLIGRCLWRITDRSAAGGTLGECQAERSICATEKQRHPVLITQWTLFTVLPFAKKKKRFLKLTLVERPGSITCTVSKSGSLLCANAVYTQTNLPHLRA